MYINNDIDYLKFLASKEIIIWGAGAKGEQICNKLMKLDYKIINFIDNNLELQKTRFEGIEIISFQDFAINNNSNRIIIICSNREKEIKEQLLNNNIYNFISVNQIDFGGGEEYYDQQYFEYQQSMGIFAAKIKADIFKPYINKEKVVVEFGSGGGYMLNELDAKEKIGIEINDTARKTADRLGIRSEKYISDIEDEYADIIISTSVLEHVENPLDVLRQLRNKLKSGGMIVFHVPNESCETEYSRSEVNNHLYTWNCLNIGNLFKAAGYFVYSVNRIQGIWPDNYEKIRSEISKEMFNTLCSIGGKAYDANYCIIVSYK